METNKLKEYKIEELQNAMNALTEVGLLTDEEVILMDNLSVEVAERLGQPKGELHITVIKGGKEETKDFSV